MLERDCQQTAPLHGDVLEVPDVCNQHFHFALHQPGSVWFEIAVTFHEFPTCQFSEQPFLARSPIPFVFGVQEFAQQQHGRVDQLLIPDNSSFKRLIVLRINRKPTIYASIRGASYVITRAVEPPIYILDTNGANKRQTGDWNAAQYSNQAQ